MSAMEFSLDRRVIRNTLGICLCVLVVAHIASAVTGEAGRLFDLDEERTVPSLFTSVLMIFDALALVLIGLVSRQHRRLFWPHWLFLGLVFVYLSIDESVGLHEMTIAPLRERLGVGGALYYAWVVPYLAALGALVVLYVPFLRWLPRRSAMTFVIAGVIYVSGAAGMEMVGAAIDAHGEKDGFGIGTVHVIEETLEVLGLIVFLDALLAHVARAWPGLQLTVADGDGLDDEPVGARRDTPAVHAR